MSEEKSTPKKGFEIPKRFLIILMASFATCIQYTIRFNLSVTIVSMVNNTKELDNSINHSINDRNTIDLFLNKTFEPKFIGCPVSKEYLNNKIEEHELKGPKLPYSESTQGFLLGAFFYGYILTHVVAGQLSSIFGAKKTIFYSLLSSSIFTLLTPYSTKFEPIVIITLRILTGMSQGIMSPAIYTLYGNWIPKEERSRAFAAFTIGGNIGSVITMPLSGYLCEFGNFFNLVEGWPLVFYTLGIMGIIFSVIWHLLVYDAPYKHPTIKQDEMLKIFNDLNTDLVGQATISYKLDQNNKINNDKQLKVKKQPKQGADVPWLKLLASKDVWIVAIAKFTVSWSSLLLMSKLPSYLERILHIPMQKNALINAGLYITLCVFAFVFGSLSDLTLRKGWISKLASRKLFESIALFGSGGCLLLIPLVSCDQTLIFSLMILSSICYQAYTGGDSIIVVDLTPTYSGSVYGLTNAVGSMPGFLAPIFVGFLLSIEESIQMWNYIWIISGCISLLGGVIFLLFASVEPIKNLDKPKLSTKSSIKSIKDNLA